MKNSKFILSAALAISSIAIIGCQTTQPSDRFAKADGNKDGKLSRDEINSYVVIGVFDSRDANKDQKMTSSEWTGGQDAGQDKLFRARDLNRDGVVTVEEAIAYGQKKGVANAIIVEA